jgi:hypothetical protein
LTQVAGTPSVLGVTLAVRGLVHRILSPARQVHRPSAALNARQETAAGNRRHVCLRASLRLEGDRMRNRKVRYVAVVATLTTIMSVLASPAAAHDPVGNTTAEPVAGEGPPDRRPNRADALKPAPAGQLGAHGGCIDMCPMDAQWEWHSHHTDAVYARWDGYIDINRSDRCLGCTITKTYNSTKGNGWNASIGFDYRVINVAVGYDTSWSTSESVSYTFKVPNGQWGRVVSRDWYHITDMYAHTNYYTELGEVYRRTNGTARGMKWWQRLWFVRTG